MTTEILEQAKNLKLKIDHLKYAVSMFNGTEPGYKDIHIGIVGSPEDAIYRVDVLREISDPETIKRIKDTIKEMIEELEEEFARL